MPKSWISLNERIRMPETRVLEGVLFLTQDRHSLPPAPRTQRDKRVDPPVTKGLHISCMTTKRKSATLAHVFGKGKQANTYYGQVILDRKTGTWKFLRKGRSVPSHESFKTRKAAVQALGLTL